jgi:hypothetical protein
LPLCGFPSLSFNSTANLVKTPTPHIIFVGAPIVLDPPTAEGRPINSIFYKLNLKDLEIHNKLPLEEHIYELEGVFAPMRFSVFIL